MSTSEKLTYLNTTKQKLKQAINNLGGDITSETTFRNYVEELEEIYDNLPKTDYAEGSNITLSNTLKGKLDYENEIVGYGDVSQDSATGSNLMNTEKIVNGTYNGLTITKDSDDFINISGTATANTSIVLSEITYNFPSTLYISYENTFTTNTAQLSFLNGSTTLGGLTFSGANRTYDMSTILGGKTCTKIELYITSGNTINGKFRPMLNTQSGQTYSKYAFPNPSYPSPVNVVRGKNVLGFADSSSKSRLGLTFTWNDSSITVNGTSTNTETVFGDGVNLKPVKVEGTYKVSGYTRSDTFFQLYWKDKNGTIKYKELKNNPTITFNEGDTLYQLFFFAAKNDILTYNNETFNLQLEKGTTVTSFLPYNTLEVKARGKNKLDFSSWVRTLMNKSPNITDGSIDSYTDNSITITASGNDCFTASYTLSNTASNNKTFCETYPSLVKEVKGNTKYTISFTRSNTSLIARPVFFYLDENYNYLGLAENTSATNSATFTTPSNAKYLTLRFGIYHSSGSTLTLSNLMIEESESATTYEPYYTPQIKQLSLGDKELAKIGTFRDTFEYDIDNDKVYKDKAINKKTFIGASDEMWELDINFQRAYNTDISSLVLRPSLSTEKFNGISDKLIIETFENVYANKKQGLACSTGGAISVHIDNVTDTLTNVSQFKTWLASNPLTLYYVLNEAVKEEITGTLKDQIKDIYNIMSYTGTTIIEIDGDLPMIMKVRAIKGE